MTGKKHAKSELDELWFQVGDLVYQSETGFLYLILTRQYEHGYTHGLFCVVLTHGGQVTKIFLPKNRDQDGPFSYISYCSIRARDAGAGG